MPIKNIISAQRVAKEKLERGRPLYLSDISPFSKIENGETGVER